LKPKRLDPQEPNRRIAWFVLFLGVFVLKLLALLQLKDHPLIQPDAGLDTTAYVKLAAQVLAGNVSLGPGLYFVSPLYIYVLSAILAVTHSYFAVRLVQIALGTGAVVCIFVMARVWFGELAAWCAAVLAAFTGVFTFFEILIQQSSIDSFLTAAALCALTFALTDPPQGVKTQPATAKAKTKTTAKTSSTTIAGRVFGPAAIAGLIFGLQTLNRPNVLIAAGAVVLALAVTKRMRLAALVLAGIVAGMAPVAIRNVVISHQFSFVSSHGGLNFYIGNGDHATGYYRQIEGITPNIDGQQTDVIRVASHALGHPVTDAEASSYFYDLAFAHMREQPGAAAGLFLRKIYYTFHATFLALPESLPFFVHEPGSILRFLFVGPWLLVPLGLAGLILRRPLMDRYLVWLAFVPAYVIAVAVFFMAERYRLPLLVALNVGAGGAIQIAVDALRARRTAALAILAGVAAPVALAANWPLQINDGRWIEGLRLGQLLLAHQRTPEAEGLIARLVPLEPRPGATEYGYGAELMDLDRVTEALPHLERAHALDPGEPSIDFALGRALLKTGRAQEALPHLKHGFDAGVPLPQGGIDYPAALRDAGAYADAITALRRIPPGDDPEALLRAGRMAVESKAPDVAEPYFRRAVELKPDASSHQQLGVDLMLLGKYDEAAHELTEAARLDPRDAGTLSHLAYCELKVGRADDARGHLVQALAVDPNDPLARQLATVLR
jgi:tetratricopeptide (TPR) repeat protein